MVASWRTQIAKTREREILPDKKCDVYVHRNITRRSLQSLF